MRDRPPAGRVAFAFLATAGLLAGCGTLTRPILGTRTVEVPARTNEVIATVQQPPQVVVVTNAVTGAPLVVTNWSEPIRVTNLVVLPPTNIVVTVTNAWEANPGLIAGIQTAKQINSMANPTGTALVVNWGLTAFGGLATLVAGGQTRRARQASSAAATADAIIETVVKAVETYPGDQIDQVKKHIRQVSALTGVADQLDERVQEVAPLVERALADGHMDAGEFIDLVNNPKVTAADLPERFRAAFTKLRN